MAINNHPITTDDPNINQMRYMIEQRAEWLYEICKELESRGIDYEPIARAAIPRQNMQIARTVEISIPDSRPKLITAPMEQRAHSLPGNKIFCSSR